MPKRGENIYKRKDGRWEGRYKSGTHLDGNAKYISVYGSSYSEAKEKLKLISQNQIRSPRCSMTVKEMCQAWLHSIEYTIKSSTAANYRMKLEKHIYPHLGALRYDMLTDEHIKRLIEYLINTGASAKYTSDILSLLKSVAKYAYKKYNYPNTIANVDYPKNSLTKSKAILSETDLNKLICEVNYDTDLTKLGILISIYTGIRIGELCALKWSDIDFESNALSINRTVQRINNPNGQGTRIEFLPPKSRSSVRMIPIPDFLITRLAEFISNDEFFILSNSDKCIEPRTMQYRFKSILKKAGVPSVNFHILRHTFATNCLRLGFDIKTLSEILGHSSVQITMNCYIHSSLERKRQCMLLIKEFDKPSELLSAKQ